jgi:hypothetical protein
MFREPKADPKPIKKERPRGKRIRPISKKMAHNRAVYSKLRKVYLEENPTCKVCNSEANQIHHKRGRGVYFLSIQTWIPVCFKCHRKIEDNPFWAYEQGYSEYRNR